MENILNDAVTCSGAFGGMMWSLGCVLADGHRWFLRIENGDILVETNTEAPCTVSAFVATSPSWQYVYFRSCKWGAAHLDKFDELNHKIYDCIDALRLVVGFGIEHKKKVTITHR